MGYNLDVSRSKFFDELSEKFRKEYFYIKEKKFLPTIDNIYYSVTLKNDYNENEAMKPFLQSLAFLKEKVITENQSQEFGNGLLLDRKSYKIYKYCLSNPSLYDIFISDCLPNINTPRLLVQIRAYGLWVYGIDEMLKESYNRIVSIVEPLGMEIEICRENRIDYCYHTNIITNPEKIFNDLKINNQLFTSMKIWSQVGRIEREDGKVVLVKDYLSFGNRKSNNVFVRIYNKTLEVVEEGYKGFFFDIWYKNGLINFYDKYCFEYAFTQSTRNYDNIHKAKLLFYLEYGTNEDIKDKFSKLLKNANTPLKEFKKIANTYMPALTTVMNIEFETKRKFYYYSDKFIDNNLKFIKRDHMPEALSRIYKIIDNRRLFLDYLTSETLSFVKTNKKDDKSEKSEDFVYVSWWNRLRNTKLDGLKVNDKLLREYCFGLDQRLAKVKFVNSVATNAVYSDKVDSGFIEDVSDVLSNFNDNDSYNFNIRCFTDDEEIIFSSNAGLLEYYNLCKTKKEKQLRNRKKHVEQDEDI